MEVVRKAVGTVLYPLQKIASLPIEWSQAGVDYASSLDTLQSENKTLILEQLQDKQRLHELETLRQENEKLRKLMNVGNTLKVKRSILSEIVSDARDPFSRKIIIGKGLIQGVKEGMPVIDELGLLGQVTRAFPSRAEVSLITDKEQIIPVENLRNGIRSVAYGGLDGGLIELRFMAANADIENNDLLVTSGLDGVYPRGIPFRLRLFLAGLFVVLLFLVLVARLLWLQVISYDKYQSKAEDNRITIVPLVPNRGLILDRNGVVLANNYSAYTLEITPSKIDNLNEMIDELGKISIPIRTRLTDEEVARFAVQSFRFPGVEIRARLFRQYPYGPHAAHLLGYIGRISARDQERIEELDQTNNYRGTAYIGKDGLEKRYETQLHGRTGFEEVETSAGGRAVRVLSRSPAVPGENLMLSIDIRLQEAAEKALDGKRGALVAIDPRNGDILAMVSAPSFDPNLFVEGIDSENWKLLNESID
eukprot:gene7752-7584_t